MNTINIIFPYPKGNYWVFDDKQYGLKEEPFVLGMSGIIDVIVFTKLRFIERKPIGLIFSKQEFPDYHVVLDKMDKKAVAGCWYSMGDPNVKLVYREGWLCPALLNYFEDYPDSIYVKVETVKVNHKYRLYFDKTQFRKNMEQIIASELTDIYKTLLRIIPPKIMQTNCIIKPDYRYRGKQGINIYSKEQRLANLIYLGFVDQEDAQEIILTDANAITQKIMDKLLRT